MSFQDEGTGDSGDQNSNVIHEKPRNFPELTIYKNFAIEQDDLPLFSSERSSKDFCFAQVVPHPALKIFFAAKISEVCNFLFQKETPMLFFSLEIPNSFKSIVENLQFTFPQNCGGSGSSAGLCAACADRQCSVTPMHLQPSLFLPMSLAPSGAAVCLIWPVLFLPPEFAPPQSGGFRVVPPVCLFCIFFF